MLEAVVKLIDISTPKHPNTFCKVDDEDFEAINRLKWRAAVSNRTVYAVRTPATGKKTTIRMHREIMGATGDEQIDHIDCDGLNNVRSNLRKCTGAENSRNRRSRSNSRSKYKGVGWHKVWRKWVATIRVPDTGKNRFIGYFKNEDDAARAYNEAAARFFGDFARLNEIPHSREATREAAEQAVNAKV